MYLTEVFAVRQVLSAHLYDLSEKLKEFSDDDDDDIFAPKPQFINDITTDSTNPKCQKDNTKSNTKAVDHDYDTDKNVKIIITSLMVLFLCLSFFVPPKTPLNIKISLVLVIVFTIYQTHLYWVVFSAKNLYRMRVLSRRVSNFAPLSVPYRVAGYEKYPITSISELCSMRGSLLHKHFSIIFILKFILVIVYAWDCSANSANGMFELHRALVVLAAFGGSIAGGMWEFDTLDRFHVIMHTIGVVLLLGGVLGLAISRHFDMTSVLWMAVACISATAYGIAMMLCIRKSDDIKVVTFRSRVLICVESIFCMTIATAIMLYIADGIDCNCQ